LQDDSTDVVFLSGMLGDVASLVGHILLRRVLVQDSRIATVDLRGVAFSCADAYIVKLQSKDKLLRLVDQLTVYDTPYDLQLRNWVHSGALGAVLLFPFLTMLSPLAEASTNGNTNETMSTYIAFRRLLAMDSQHYPGDIMASIDRIDPSFYDKEANDLAKAFRCLLSRKFVFG
jgi:hypothetical protein